MESSTVQMNNSKWIICFVQDNTSALPGGKKKAAKQNELSSTPTDNPVGSSGPKFDKALYSMTGRKITQDQVSYLEKTKASFCFSQRSKVHFLG